MCKEYDENRERLAELIFRLKSFTEEELSQAFSNSGKTELGLLRSTQEAIHDYLGDLTEFGVLRYELGRYHVLESKPRHAAAA